MSGKRARLLGLLVTPHLVIDDGENLTPIQASPLTVPAARLDDLPKLIRDALIDIQEQLNKEEGEEGQ